MFNLFKSKPQDVKGIRNAIIMFIKEELKKNEGGEGGNIKALLLYVTCLPTEEQIYRAALFADEPDKFKKEEVQKIADDFNISLPNDWKLKMFFNKEFPPSVIKATNVDIALDFITNKTVVKRENVEAFLTALNGKTEKSNYKITSQPGKINIGREIQAQTADGFFRKNDIAFINPDEHSANRSISRQHGHIEWREESNCFYLYADEGGIPPHNKMKVRGENGVIEKIQTTELGHRLKEGDQIILGDQAVLEFTFQPPDATK